MTDKELMVNDFVLWDGKVAQVETVWRNSHAVKLIINEQTYRDAFLTDVNPIPITPEILEKNGFEKCEDSIMYVWKLSKLQCGTMSFYKTANKTLMFDITGNYLTHRKFSGELKYIHELQHTLKLCGFDKEIRL